MSENSSDLPHELIAADLAEFLETAAEQSWPVGAEELDGPKSFRFALGQQPIQLGNIEFRILLFLASRPYHAFSRRAVAEAVSTDLAPSAKSISTRPSEPCVTNWVYSTTTFRRCRMLDIDSKHENSINRALCLEKALKPRSPSL